MSLPENNSPLYPEDQQPLYEKYEEWATWYSGDPTRIANFYDQRMPDDNFWGTAFGKKKPKKMLHVPVAGDLAQTSSDLLFNEAPRFKFKEESKATEERFQEISEKDNLMGKLLESGEVQAALSGVFLKINWDISLASHPILSIAQVDNAVAEFKHGYLTAVTFRKDIQNERNSIYRHVERHEMRGETSYILNGLYKGTRKDYGKRLDLSEHPYTQNMQDEINTGINSLLVRYIPNKRPNRLFRGSPYGMSDFAGIEGLMDALDEAYTSWMRDIRLGKARIMIPDTWLKRNEETGELGFDDEEEVYAQMDVDPLAAKNVTLTPVEFKIRTQEHEQTCMNLVEQIVVNAGYSPQSFGLHIEGQAESGTALNVRERKSLNTASKKQNTWKRPLEDIAELMLEVDSKILGNDTTVERPSVEFGDPGQTDVRALAETVELIRRAKAATTRTLVAMLHPDWSKEQIEEEAAALDREQGMLEDPIQEGVAD